MDPRVSPLLLRCAGSVSRAPGGEAAIVGGPQKSLGYTGSRRLFRETPRRWKTRPPGRRVSAPPRCHTAVGLEAGVGRRVAPVFGGSPSDFGRPPSLRGA